jgi:hypothetical protein
LGSYKGSAEALPFLCLPLECATGQNLSDPATADYNLAIVEYSRLAGRNGALRVIECSENFVRARLFNYCGCSFVAMTNFHGDSHRLAKIVDRDQIRSVDAKSSRVEFFLISNHNLMSVALDLNDIERRPGGYA